MIKILETKKVNLKFSDLEPGEVFTDNLITFIKYEGDRNTAIALESPDSPWMAKFHNDEIITEVVTKYEYTHDKQ